jgi:hypothetical protein
MYFENARKSHWFGAVVIATSHNQNASCNNSITPSCSTVNLAVPIWLRIKLTVPRNHENEEHMRIAPRKVPRERTAVRCEKGISGISELINPSNASRLQTILPLTSPRRITAGPPLLSPTMTPAHIMTGTCTPNVSPWRRAFALHLAAMVPRSYCTRMPTPSSSAASQAADDGREDGDDALERKRAVSNRSQLVCELILEVLCDRSSPLLSSHESRHGRANFPTPCTSG